MRDYLLFVDTETSGLPVDWEKPYHAEGNWPYIVQLAWVIYTRQGKEVKRENHFIKNQDFSISQSSRAVHGITDQFLQEHGQERAAVMQRIYDDLQQYCPLVVGHFMQLDYHMLSLGFFRTGLPNPLLKLPTFCTMQVTRHFIQQPGNTYLRLNELYYRLFHQSMLKQHDALLDAEATARCFFELERLGDIRPETIAAQKHVYDDVPPPPSSAPGRRWLFYALILLLLLILIIFFLMT